MRRIKRRKRCKEISNSSNKKTMEKMMKEQYQDKNKTIVKNSKRIEKIIKRNKLKANRKNIA